MTTPEQPYGPGAMCEDCGHFAARHNEDGCTFDRPDPLVDCACPSMRWLGLRWLRPWLPAPDGMLAAARTSPSDVGGAFDVDHP